MNQQNTNIYGKKIYFVSATFTLNTNIILRLMEQEYEIYKVDEYRQLKSLLQLNPDSICFINLDSQNSYNTWFNFIRYFENTEAFSTISFGVFGGKWKGGEEERFRKSLKLKAGLYVIGNSFGEIMGNLMMKLDELNAKGLRKFVRINCLGDKTTDVYILRQNMMYKMELLDISSIGMGIKIPARYGQLFRPGMSVIGLTVVLGSKQLKVNSKVYGIKPDRDGMIAVLVYSPETPDTFRNYVRSFICERLQKKMMDAIIQLPWDRNDYTIEMEFEETSDTRPAPAEDSQADSALTEEISGSESEETDSQE